MVLVALTRPIEIYGQLYLQINTQDFDPSTLKCILIMMPENENRTGKQMIVKALKTGDYKREDDAIYFVPLLTNENKTAIVTDICWPNISLKDLVDYRFMVTEQTPENKSAITELESIIINRCLATNCATSGPLKKRKFVNY